MTGPSWVPTISENKVAEGTYAAVFPKGVGVLVARIDDELVAVANKCAHMGCPLEGGRLEGAILTCPCHDWRFDLRTGQFLAAEELKLRTFPVKVEDGKICVELAEV